ncbi:defects in morphology protein 1 [Histoplasma capsulatum]|uniref:Defects in morphology protein 1 n=1 Tax=Ajellomyces capsulatus TaxID=5037 RepID=A0A8A1M658_AJECA|nr:defects in morphology protein 1 [Histoplasma capsulatum]
MSQSAFLEKPAAGPLPSPQPPTVPSPLAATRENTTTGEDTLDSAASSDYGSDFSPDEEELLNLLLARIGEDHEQATTVVPGSGSPSVFATPALTPLAVSSDPAGAEEGAESGAIGIGYPETIAQLQLQSQSLPLLPLTDIEDYVGISRDRVPRVLGREKWGPIQQRAGPEGRYFGGGRGRGNGKGWEWLEAGSGSWGAEHPNSAEGRERERQREVERERGHIAVDQGAQDGNANGLPIPDMRSPLERFRTPPRKALSVTDLVSPAWCELQYWYTLTKLGRKRATPAMKQGTVVHKELEDQVHTTVPVEVMTKEDGWALRIWNVIQGLRTLRVSGMTRELEVWGNVDGEIVTGIIDQLSYDCPDEELEESAEASYADLRTSKALLPEYQTSITDFFLSPAGGGRRLSDIGVAKHERDMAYSAAGSPETPVGFRPTHLQLQLYYHFLTRLVTTDDVTIDAIATRYKLEVDKPFSDSFIAQVGSLNEQFFDASEDLDADYFPSSSGAESEGEFPSSSQDSMTILLEHNSLSRLWKLMKSQHRLTFLPPNTNPSTTTHSQPQDDAQEDTPPFPTLLSPVLTATYIAPPSSPDESMQYIGSRSFLFNPSSLYSYLTDEMHWWRGHRQPRGVPIMEAWKCRICEFQEECTWRREMEGKMAVNKRRKREGEEANGEGPMGPVDGNGNADSEGGEDVSGQSVV